MRDYFGDRQFEVKVSRTFTGESKWDKIPSVYELRSTETVCKGCFLTTSTAHSECVNCGMGVI